MWKTEMSWKLRKNDDARNKVEKMKDLIDTRGPVSCSHVIHAHAYERQQIDKDDPDTLLAAKRQI